MRRYFVLTRILAPAAVDDQPDRKLVGSQKLELSAWFGDRRATRGEG
jgi:hypothetical protein